MKFGALLKDELNVKAKEAEAEAKTENNRRYNEILVLCLDPSLEHTVKTTIHPTGTNLFCLLQCDYGNEEKSGCSSGNKPKTVLYAAQAQADSSLNSKLLGRLLVRTLL